MRVRLLLQHVRERAQPHQAHSNEQAVQGGEGRAVTPGGMAVGLRSTKAQGTRCQAWWSIQWCTERRHPEPSGPRKGGCGTVKPCDGASARQHYRPHQASNRLCQALMTFSLMLRFSSPEPLVGWHRLALRRPKAQRDATIWAGGPQERICRPPPVRARNMKPSGRLRAPRGGGRSGRSRCPRAKRSRCHRVAAGAGRPRCPRAAAPGAR